MAASVNNIAAAFSSASRPAAPSSPSFSPSPSPPATATFSSTAAATSSGLTISASWNPHSSLPRSRFSSLLSFYGPPGPRPRPSPSPLSHPSRRGIIAIGDGLPFSTLSYLSDRTVLTTSPAELARGTKAVILGVPAAFAPRQCLPIKLTAEELVTRAGEMKGRGAAVLACVSVNDVFVMRAWGESIGARDGTGAGVMMLSDPDAGMARAMGLAADFIGGAEGFGLRSENYCVVAADGIVKAVFREEDGVGFDDVVRAI